MADHATVVQEFVHHREARGSNMASEQAPGGIMLFQKYKGSGFVNRVLAYYHTKSNTIYRFQVENRSSVSGHYETMEREFNFWNALDEDKPHMKLVPIDPEVAPFRQDPERYVSITAEPNQKVRGLITQWLKKQSIFN